jgi:hypothetical protein
MTTKNPKPTKNKAQFSKLSPAQRKQFEAEKNKHRIFCARCHALKFSKFLKVEFISGKARHVCINEDKCTTRCANYG